VYRKLGRSEGDVLGIELEERFSEADVESIERELDTAIAEHGSVRLLVRFESFPRPELDALDDDLAFWSEHGDDIERYAVVSEGTLAAWASELGDFLSDTDVRHFDPDSEGDAWEWLEG
jgi:hypothetical protein